MRSFLVRFPGVIFLVAVGACSSGGGGGAASCADGGVCPNGTVCNPSTSLCEAAATGGSGGGGNAGGMGAVGNNGGVGNTAGAGNTGALGGGAGTGATVGVGGSGPCVTGTCQGYTIGGILPMNGCCPNSGAGCGGEIDATISGLVGVPEGCYPLNAPGAQTSACPDFYYTNPTTSAEEAFPGCCMPGGKCGALADLTSVGGPDFGCADAFGASADSCSPTP